MRRWILALAVMAAAGAGGFAYYQSQLKTNGPRYRLAKVERGPIRMTVSSTGKVNPVGTVQVGSLVSGRIIEIAADFNTAVRENTMIARIDPASFEARARAARAELAIAEGNVRVQQAGMSELRADLAGTSAALAFADQELARNKTSFARKLIAKSKFDESEAAQRQARARVDGAMAKLEKQKAQIVIAFAQVDAKAATLRDRAVDLENTIIRSPVDGVVIGRDVELGQSVAASLQAPVLFTIAKNLDRMQLEINVDEADIGRVKEGQQTRFTVDAYPGRDFSGAVIQIRKSPQVESNVVTYTVIARTTNPNAVLLPGMTANVEIMIGQRQDVVKIPDSALRFRPKGSNRQGRANGSHGGPGGDALRGGLRRLTTELELTADQQKRVGSIFKEIGSAVRGLRESGAPPEELRGAMQQLREQARSRIAPLLNPEQRRKFREIKEKRMAGERKRGQVWVLNGDGQPQAVEIVIGISDGSMTEVISGELVAGADVIVRETTGADD